MRFLGRKRRPSLVEPRKNQWKDPQGERAGREAQLGTTARRKTLTRWAGVIISTVLVAGGIVISVKYAGPALQALLEIKTITIEGGHHIDRQKVLDLAKVKSGTASTILSRALLRSRWNLIPGSKKPK